MDTNEKISFIHNELWILVFGAAFQRAKIYKKGVIEKQKMNFRRGLKTLVVDDIIPKYKESVKESEHLKYIRQINDFSEEYAVILNNDRLTFGVSQKILNLALKYYWCLGEIKEPPHFPVDRRIQQKIPGHQVISWTNLNCEEEYLSIIDAAKSKLANGQCLAEWKLENFNRR
ncbi:MAG: hypothetical protein ABJH05_12305 [Fulvivirga sp.]